MPIKPIRVTTCGRGSNWGFRVLGPDNEVLASRWRFTTEHAARQAGISASLALNSTSLNVSPTRIDRSLQKAPGNAGNRPRLLSMF